MPESNTSVSYLNLLLSVGRSGQLRTSLYDQRDYFNFHITIIPLFISNIRSSPAYGVLSHSSYGMPGLSLLMNLLFQGRCEFHLISSDRDLSGNFWNHLWGCSMVDMGISSNIMMFPFLKCYNSFWNKTIYSDILNWSDITPLYCLITEHHLITDSDLITQFREASI